MVECTSRKNFLIIGVIFMTYGGQRGNIALGREKWTEQDEARRIQQAEEMEYEMEQRSQSASAKLYDNAQQQSYYHNPITESYPLNKRTLSATKMTFSPNIASKNKESNDWVKNSNSNPNSNNPKDLLQQGKVVTKEIFIQFKILSVQKNKGLKIFAVEDHWCYHCASPLSTVSGGMRRAIEKLLQIRRTAYPANVRNPRCSEPRNLTDLAVERCRHPYCQTLILTDHGTGAAFAIRGCAETFGGINEDLLKSRGDNTCLRLHDQLDIQECICKSRRYCYPGAERHFFGASASASASEAFIASAPIDKIVLLFIYYIIIASFSPIS
ncbi:unnamed protein product [Thelazia callipaeda]|uniref:Uncharacterized protein n=1 Tax=Thelazia callipaeda TaxID=103827 RepID=A0A0N5D2P0_THECL|nr:unnamed protein product [Thelazia callipaeda]